MWKGKCLGFISQSSESETQIQEFMVYGRTTLRRGSEGHDMEERRELSKDKDSAGVQHHPDPTGALEYEQHHRGKVLASCLPGLVTVIGCSMCKWVGWATPIRPSCDSLP